MGDCRSSYTRARMSKLVMGARVLMAGEYSLEESATPAIRTAHSAVTHEELGKATTLS
jgi:hypothetical protein